MNDAELLSVVFLGVVVAFYIMFMRPIQKDQERHRKQMRDLRPGDKVVTTSNFIATIKDIQVLESGGTQIALELADGLIVTALPNAILRRLEPETAAVAKNAPTGQTPSTGSGQAGA